MIVVKSKHLNSFLYLNMSTIMIVVKLNHHLYIIFTTQHMIIVELDMNYVYYMNSNLIFLNPLYVDFKS